ncbi:MAG: glycosyl hydrolase 115 family protein, partial [Bacteroidaceae bacterium]|nr:glycosyl hydrolase 115 family protein [Bacteroidaceae bacterium]
MRRTILSMLTVCVCLMAGAADQFVSFQKGDFAIAKSGQPLNIVVSDNDYEGVRMAAESLQGDFLAVTGQKPSIVSTANGQCVIVGSLQSSVIQQLMKAGKIEKADLVGKTEKYLLQVVEKPMSGIEKALVIAGSDKRGAIYGIYELSRQMGVSPWYWFADVPVQKHQDIYIKKGIYTDGEPKVRWRGIFINDEHPSFFQWSNEKFGGQNAKCYVHIFELLLRLKANYMWPAMWGNAFYDDDPANGVLADKMGIVMGTSHHEPLALAQQDWKRRKGHGAWSFVNNREEMLDFWRGGVARSKNWETMYTIGMRGDGDSPMEDKGSVALMEEIVKAQRQLISEVTGKKASDVPQVWALYKEVQDYYDQGMQVPDDVTLLLCDDNWGNVRRVPTAQQRGRKGGFGMYYHFDYVGTPRNSKWVNISPIPRVW